MDKKVGIIGAMEEEVDHLKGCLDAPRITELLGMEFCEGTLHGVPVVVVKCGVGKVNAALCAAALALRFGVTCVINTGVAGSLDASIDIGDIVVSTDAVQHDIDTTALGHVPGQIFRMDFDGVATFVADPGLRAAAVEAVGVAAPDVRVFEGRVASGDQFIASEAQKDFIVNTFGALCAEMEGAAIAHALHLAQVPFVIVRAISDKADGSAHVDYPTFEVEAARHCSRIVEYMVAHLR